MIKLGQYKSQCDNLIVINEVLKDFSYGRIMVYGRWVGGAWRTDNGKFVNSINEDWDIKIPKRTLKAYRCRTMTRCIVDNTEFWSAPGSIRLLDHEDKIQWLGAASNWERIPSMDVEMES